MTITAVTGGGDITELEAPLLDDVVRGSVDFNGRPAVRSKSGCWTSAYFMIGVEVAERFAYYGISANLISYLTGPLGQSTAAAAANVNAWSGTASLLPLLGGFIADSFLGRYRTIIVASVIYILGLGFLTLSAALSSSHSSACESNENNSGCSPPTIEVVFFFFSLYLVAFGQGGHKPCVCAFGADQFDEDDKKERKAKSSFFNWWYFSMASGVFFAQLVLSYVQENMSWELGFGIPAIFMFLALIVFLLGSVTYRFSMISDQRNPFVRIGMVFVNAARNWNSASAENDEDEQILHTKSSFLDRAFLESSKEERVRGSSIRDVEDAKAILRLVPIWCTCLAYAIVFAQASTLFTKQGATMDRAITSSFEIPAASLQSIIHICVVIFVPIYDRVLVPIFRAITKKPVGITMLQRIGTGIFISILLMVTAALVESKRLATAEEYGLVDEPEAVVPMSAWWLTPQYLLLGVADVFTVIGLQEFFYDQVPADLKSIGLALYLSVFGVGSFMSSFLISVIDEVTGGDGGDSWFSSNLNRGHIDYFYWLLAGITTGNEISEAEPPLLNDVVRNAVDYNGQPAHRSNSGYWKSASFIIGVEVVERLTHYGISSNLVTYLTGQLGQSTAAAAANVNAWSGTVSFLPLLGAFLADSFLGQFRMIIAASLLYILGLGFLFLEAAFFNSSNCQMDGNKCSPSQFQIIFFFLSLYLVAFAQGGHKPCVQAFGADQFDEEDKKERKSKSTFFNLWYFCVCVSVSVGILGLNYIEDNLSWGLCFGISCLVMFFALVLFLLGIRTYRYSMETDEVNPFVRVGRAFVKLARARRREGLCFCVCEAKSIEVDHQRVESMENGDNMLDVDEAKAILNLVPIWFTCLGYAVVYSQNSTLYTKQGATMDRYITSSFQIPAASLLSCISLTIVVFVPIYDRLLIPIARAMTKKPTGISMLQRIGTGLFLSFLSIVIAAVVEHKRLAAAAAHGLIDEPHETVPMSVWWLGPQYVLFGVADVFTLVGLQEFFYDQVSSELKSIGIALGLSVTGVGGFLSSFLIYVVDKLSSGGGRHSWFSDNLNRAHLDYFYWLLAGISAIEFAAFVYFARSFRYHRGSVVA
ncbi:Major facilitator superfamily protein [Perilla frutescens var. frutescens]|nr:Major facilitator superfamily protein [Perilla frutescens var. frutescens]